MGAAGKPRARLRVTHPKEVSVRAPIHQQLLCALVVAIVGTVIGCSASGSSQPSESPAAAPVAAAAPDAAPMSLFKADQAVLSNEEIRQILGARIYPPARARLAVLRLGAWQP